ncbi:NAD-dependent epimerase/dehydratase family protein [Paenibacillus sp. NPDC058071]|uniref:NAD-dependent epimerase/dehydratase family protein n=1 Tax=Paenibacillus sp. NPDC058071 TaxID=3346326 RepID=UPI0036DE736D
MKTVVVTGSEGKLGRFVIEDLNRAGYRVIGTDNRPPKDGRYYAQYVQADLSQLGEVYGILAGADAVVHLAAVPNPINFSPERIFANNMMSAYNVMEAASKLGIKRVVTGSSESAYGFCWAKYPFAPDYFPVDEEHRLLPQESYGLSKGLCEDIGDMFARRVGMEVFALRFSLLLGPEEYQREIDFFADTARHHRILWSYVDARDAAAACRLALEAPAPAKNRACRLGITASDPLSDTDALTLAKRHYPQVPLAESVIKSGFTALVANKLAFDAIAWRPAHSWRDAVKAE